MNYLYVILGVVVIIILYILYQYLATSTSTLTNQTNLKKQLSLPAVTDNPSTNSYSYGLWLYINSVPGQVTKSIFTTTSSPGSMSTSAGVTGIPPMNLLYSTTDKSVLVCEILTGPTLAVQKFNITTNFPIQKWVYIVINVQNGNFVDFYLDGKLIKSIQMPANQQNASSDQDGVVITGENNGLDALIAGFTRTSTSVNPQDVWSSYLAGNGGNSLSKTFSSYGIQVDLVKDNVTQSKFTLF
jgi:hypothetical protein